MPIHLKALSLLVLFFFPSLYCAAQADTVYAPSTKLFIEPLAIIDIASSSQPSLRLGIDIPITQKITLITIGGLYTGGYYVKTGIKKYMHHFRAGVGFLELSGFYKNESHKVNDNIRLFEPGAGYPSEGDAFSYDVSKVVYGINLEVGETLAFDHLYFEWFAGAGVRHRNVAISISDSMQNELYHHHESIIDAVTNAPSTNKLTLSLSAGIRLGLVFWCRQRFR